jgi:hypothetical protein
MDMEIALTNPQDVTEPDHVAFGDTASGPESGYKTGIDKHVTGKNVKEFSTLQGFIRILPAEKSPYGFTGSGPVTGTITTPSVSHPVLRPEAGPVTGAITNLSGSHPVLCPEAGPVTGTKTNPSKSHPVLCPEAGLITGAKTNSTGSHPVPGPVSLKKTRKNMLVIGMGILYNGEIKAGVNKNSTPAPQDLYVEDEYAVDPYAEDLGEDLEEDPDAEDPYTVDPEEDPDAEDPEKDLIFLLPGQKERIADRVTKKIYRLERRQNVFDERRST